MGLHHHHNNPQGENRSLLLATLLNVLITAVEIIGGILSNSLALLSDAIHNFSDTLAILLAYVAGKVSKRKSNERKTFGYKRIEILAAFFNALVLIGISVFLVYESILRFSDPEPIKGLMMLIVATLGLLFNLAAVVLLKKHSSSSLNIRSAYLHLLGDTLSSFAVIIGGILIYFFEVYWVDPAITILISIYIVRETWGVFRDSSNILLMATPEGLEVQQITDELMQIDGISNIHHVHLWGLSEKEFHFECHVDLEQDLAISKTDPIKNKMLALLKNKFGIGHLTVQFEYGSCDDQKIIHQG
jgi:cobalt-zinc-cadmium efflux system protein